MAGHPSDADREAKALPVLVALIDAARAGDAAALEALYREDVAWLEDGLDLSGPAQAAARHLQIARGAADWDPPQQAGAKAVLRWTTADGARGAMVVEVRGDRVVFAAA